MEKKERSAYQKAYRETYNKKNKYVNVSVPIADYKRLESVAQKQKKKPSAYLRELAFAQLDKQVLLSDDLEQALYEHNRLIRNIANNLNQLAHSSNIFRDVDRDRVFQHLQQLDEQVKSFIEVQSDK